MISLKLAVGLLALNIVSINAAPAEKRENVLLSIYDEKDFKGEVFRWEVDSDKCENVPSGWNDRILSLAADNIFDCYWYTDISCEGDEHRAYRDDNLESDSGKHAKSISSVKCERK